MRLRVACLVVGLLGVGCGDDASSSAGGSPTTGGQGGAAGEGGTGATAGSGGEGGAAPKELGTSCAESAECGSGFCVDAVCCESACTDLCFACAQADTGEASGTCAAAAQGNDPHDDCPGAPCIADVCDGSGACELLPDATVCREAAGVCDLAEECLDGMCPADEKVAVETECRAAAGDCDVAESCDGVANDCPSDVSLDSTVVCRAATDVCDLEEKCSGEVSCPADSFAPSSAECGAFLCTGNSAACETSCSAHSDCAANAFCNTLGTCTLGKVAFTTSTTTNGNIGGLAGADALCQTRAQAAGLPGTYRAWLSDSTISAAARFTQASIPYAYVNGTVIASNWADLTDGTIGSPFRITEFGVQVPGNLPFTSTAPNGDQQGPEYCVNWTSTVGSVWTGQSDQTGTAWTFAQNNSGNCNILHRLYCFQQ